jgi:hypothetical protein
MKRDAEAARNGAHQENRGASERYAAEGRARTGNLLAGQWRGNGPARAAHERLGRFEPGWFHGKRCAFCQIPGGSGAGTCSGFGRALVRPCIFGARASRP